jgi:hypothetical protein
MREALVRTRTRYLLVIRAVLRREGIRVPSGSAATFGRRREQVELSRAQAAVVAPLGELLVPLNAAIAAADAGMARRLAADPVARRLAATPGVGPVTAVAFVATLDDVTGARGPARSRPTWAWCRGSTPDGGWLFLAETAAGTDGAVLPPFIARDLAAGSGCVESADHRADVRARGRPVCPPPSVLGALLQEYESCVDGSRCAGSDVDCNRRGSGRFCVRDRVQTTLTVFRRTATQNARLRSLATCETQVGGIHELVACWSRCGAAGVRCD